MQDVKRGGKGRIQPGCCGAGRASTGVLVLPRGLRRLFGGEFLVFWKPEAAWKRRLQGRDLDGRGEERRRGRAPEAATKGRALPQGSSGFAFRIGLGYKSHLPGMFGGPRDPSGVREAEGPSWEPELRAIALMHRLSPSLGTHLARV